MGWNSVRFCYSRKNDYDEHVIGRFGKGIIKYVVFLTFLLLLIQIFMAGVNGEPILYEHHVIMIQGDDSGTEVIEPENEIFAQERFFFSVPWNESVVEVPVPKGAKSMSLDQFIYLKNQGFFPMDYSAYWDTDNPPIKQFKEMEDMGCCIADEYDWGIPEGADRNLTFSIRTDAEAEFNLYFDDTASDDAWNFSDDNLKLEPGKAYGKYISQPINKLVIDTETVDFINITSVEMSWKASMHEENITFYISNNGTDWYDISGYKNEEFNFSAQGNELRWKINMSQDTKLNNSPILDDIYINVTFTPKYNDIILQLTYVVERDPDTKKFEYSIDLDIDYFYEPFLHIIIYINNDNILNSSGVQLTLYEDQTEYPDKNAYIYMSLEGATSNFATVTIQPAHKANEEDNQLCWIGLALLMLVALIIGTILVTRSRVKEKEEPSEAQASEVQEEEIEKLEERKELLLKAIKKLDTDFDDGLLDEEVYNEMRNTYKSRAADVMKQMDVLVGRGAGASAQPEITTERKTLLEKKEKILKSIKKLDNDYNEGLLDEDVYNELRADYKKKAIDIAKELDEDQ